METLQNGAFLQRPLMLCFGVDKGRVLQRRQDRWLGLDLEVLIIS